MFKAAYIYKEDCVTVFVQNIASWWTLLISGANWKFFVTNAIPVLNIQHRSWLNLNSPVYKKSMHIMLWASMLYIHITKSELPQHVLYVTVSVSDLFSFSFFSLCMYNISYDVCAKYVKQQVTHLSLVHLKLNNHSLYFSDFVKIMKGFRIPETYILVIFGVLVPNLRRLILTNPNLMVIRKPGNMSTVKYLFILQGTVIFININ